MSLGSTVAYGLLHNLVTGQVCSAYFTRFHPPLPVVGTVPTALAWAVLSTWWIGVILGVAFAAMAQLGKAPPISATQIWPRLRWLGLIMASTAGCFASLAWLISFQGGFPLDPTLLLWLPIPQHAPCTAVAAAHRTSYSIGLLGSLVLLLWIARQRWPMRRSSLSSAPRRRWWLGPIALGGTLVLCGGVMFFDYSLTAGINNFYIGNQRELMVDLSQEAWGTDQLTFHAVALHGTPAVIVLRGPVISGRSSDPRQTPADYTRRQLTAEEVAALQALQQEWCAKPLPSVTQQTPADWSRVSLACDPGRSMFGALPFAELPPFIRAMLAQLPAPS
jgi:hypothetical protein